MGINIGFGRNSESSTNGQTTQKILDQKGIDKIIYDVMASDQGLSALATGENASGGYNSTTKSLLAQDLITKITGEIANITAPTVTSSSSSKSSKSAGLKTVICTELMRQGLLDEELYAAGAQHFNALSPYTVAGYRVWANHCVPILARNPNLAKRVAPIAVKRYEYIVHGKKTLTGMATVYLCQPVCFVIGLVLAALISPSKIGDKYARAD